MNRAFWQGFKEGFSKASVIGVLLALAFVSGLTLGSYSHPYEVCNRMYNTPEDVIECIWIKTNP